ncbi:DUF3068 domain-containing protein [Streptomyces sp. NPDC002004]
MRRTAHPSSGPRPSRPQLPPSLPFVLLGLGVFLLVLSPLLARYVEPRAARTPVGVDTTAVFTGTGSYFDTRSVSTLHHRRITVTQQVRGDVADGVRSGHAVWDVSTSVTTDGTKATADPHTALQWTLERWVTDRSTNAPVHCCAEHPYFEGEAYLKFPFDLRKRAYRWWDDTLGATVELTYRGTRRVQGYEGYRFTGTVAPTRTGTRLVPGRLVGEPERSQVLAEEWYANHGIDLVADQRTGRIIYAAIGPRKTLRAPGTHKNAVVLLDSRRIAFTTATQKQQVGLARTDSGRLRLLGRTLPVGAGAAGLVLATAGAVLVVRRRPHPGVSPTSL